MKIGDSKLTDAQVRFVTRLSLAGVVTRYPEELKRTINDYPASVTEAYLKSSKDVVKCLKQQIK